MAKFLTSLTVLKKLSKVLFFNSASGFKISAYLVFTFDNPRLLPLAYPKFSPAMKHSTFVNFFSIFSLKDIFLEFSIYIETFESY